MLKDEVFRMEKHPNYMTVPAAIRELEKIEMVKGLDKSLIMIEASKNWIDNINIT